MFGGFMWSAALRVCCVTHCIVLNSIHHCAGVIAYSQLSVMIAAMRNGLLMKTHDLEILQLRVIAYILVLATIHHDHSKKTQRRHSHIKTSCNS